MKHSKQTKIAHQPGAAGMFVPMEHALQAAITALHALTAQKELVIQQQAMISILQLLRAKETAKKVK